VRHATVGPAARVRCPVDTHFAVIARLARLDRLDRAIL
jgi:hypothetical protein